MNKKILIIINNLGIGGAERLVVDEINEMIRIGVQVTLITLKPESSKSFTTRLKLNPDKIHCVPFRNGFSLFSWFKLIRLIRVSEPNLVITQLWFANTIGRIAAKIAGAKKVISFEQNVYDTVKNDKMFFLDWCLQFLSTKIIAVSEAVKKSLIQHSIKESKIEVIHNSIDLSKFSISNYDPGVRKRFHISENSFLFIFIGRLIYQKGVDVLIEAFKKIGEGSYLLIVGQGKDRNTLESEVEKRSLQKQVIFTGVQDDIPRLLSSADCFVLPSRYEGLPLVLTEALAAGAVIIVSDFEAAREMIIPEENGLIVPKEDALALAQAMMRVKDDKILRSTLSSGAKKTAEQFSISHHTQAVLGYANI